MLLVLLIVLAVWAVVALTVAGACVAAADGDRAEIAVPGRQAVAAAAA